MKDDCFHMLGLFGTHNPECKPLHLDSKFQAYQKYTKSFRVLGLSGMQNPACKPFHLNSKFQVIESTPKAAACWVSLE